MTQAREKRHGGARPGAGRPAGVANKVNLATRERIEQQADPVGFYVSVAKGDAIEVQSDDAKRGKVYPTLEQRMAAHRVLLNKIQPDAKSVPIRIDLPEIKTAADVVEAQSRVLAAVANGELLPDHAEMLASIIEAKRSALETLDMERRIAALEQGTGA